VNKKNISQNPFKLIQGLRSSLESGKTRLMLMIEDHIKEKKINTIWFNARKHGEEEIL